MRHMVKAAQTSRRFLSAIKCSLIAFYALLICASVCVCANAFAIALFVTVFVSQSSQLVNQPYTFRVRLLCVLINAILILTMSEGDRNRR